MRIRNIHVHNYRSICDLEMKCESLVVLLGPNNHGKSNVISAIEFALSSGTKPRLSDLCAFCGDEREFWVELTFSELSEQEQTTFRRYLQADGSIRFRKTAKFSGVDAVEVAYNGYIQEPDEWWLKDDRIRDLATREEVLRTPLANLVPETGRLTNAHIRDAQQNYMQQHRDDLVFSEALETSPFLGQKNVAAGVLPDFFLVPAVKDLADETKVKNTTAFGRLLNRAVREMAERDPRFRELREGLEQLVSVLNRIEGDGSGRPQQLVTLENSLRTELGHWGVNVEIEVIPPVIEKIFELGTNLHLDDGVRTLAEQKGHGLQRAVIFALVRAWANALRTPPDEDGGVAARASSDSLIFAMEEPELFLHPHAQRRLARSIRQISESQNHQVFITTHSTHFLDLDNYRNICIANKSTAEVGTKVRQCMQELFAGEAAQERKHRFHIARWVNPDRGELFFAKRVVFVEGETEGTILPYLAEKMGCFDEEISIVDCGSKHNLPLYVALANAFQIPYVVLHDEDPLPEPIPEDWNEDKRRSKRKTFELNREISNVIDPRFGRVEVLSPDFERASGVSRTQGEKKGKPLAALDHFERTDEIPEVIMSIVNVIYSPAV